MRIDPCIPLVERDTSRNLAWLEQVSHDAEFLDLWPSSRNMPSWVVWAVFAVVRFHLIEVPVPPGVTTLEKLATLAPGVADPLPEWAKATAHWWSTGFGRERG